jgi:DNA polymerase III alpha subunit
LPEEKKIRRELIELAEKPHLPLVAANESHYLSEDDALAHEILMCIGEGKTITDSTAPISGMLEIQFADAAEMWEAFRRGSSRAFRKHSENCRAVSSRISERKQFNATELPDSRLGAVPHDGRIFRESRFGRISRCAAEGLGTDANGRQN